MKEITLEDLIENVEKYNPEGVLAVKKAYDTAKALHDGQYRESGEPYIMHPLNVAYILSEMHADTDTVCAGLLHDTLEDTEISKEEIASRFNGNVANLVDGVTKIRKLDYQSDCPLDDEEEKRLKEERNLANTRKIIAGITKDVRIILIKLADRLHNMRTIDSKKKKKKIVENSYETMELFVPLAYYLGAYRIKTELEDLSFKHINPGKYKEISNIRDEVEFKTRHLLEYMSEHIEEVLINNNLSLEEIKIRIKNVYSLYKKLEEKGSISEIGDLLSLKVMLKEVSDCYLALGLIHKEYNPVNGKIKDFICNPKTNMYQSLHTTVFAPEGRLVQTQIRTTDMDRVASFGLATYWDIHKGNARDEMQNCLRNKFQFYESLTEIDQDFENNLEFVKQAKKELLGNNVFVYSMTGERFMLPEGSTAIDFAYKIHSDIGNTMVYAIVNDRPVDATYVLKSKDRVQIITDVMSYGPRKEWESVVRTSAARRKIREHNKK